MTATTTDLGCVAATLQAFTGANLTATLARLEGAIHGHTVLDSADQEQP